MSKFDANTCQILRLKSTKFDFRWGSIPDPAGGAYSALPDPLAVFKGLEPPLPGGRNICRHCPPPLRYATLLCIVESCIWFAGHSHSEAID